MNDSPRPMSEASGEHEHTYTHKGAFYIVSPYPRPGSDAHNRSLVDVFYCTRCLAEEVRNARPFGTTYDATGGVLPR